MADYPDIYIIR